MDVRQISYVRYFMGSLLGVTKENSEEPLFLQVIVRRVWSGNSRTEITIINSAIHSLFDIIHVENLLLNIKINVGKIS